jgi:hypothetical protein
VTATATIFVWALLLSGPIAVVLTWRIALLNGPVRSLFSSRSNISLILITLSLLLLICGYIWPIALGPYYSRMRFGLIFGNMGVMLLIAIASAFSAKPIKAYLLASSIILAVDWAYVWVINSTV